MKRIALRAQLRSCQSGRGKADLFNVSSLWCRTHVKFCFLRSFTGNVALLCLVKQNPFFTLLPSGPGNRLAIAGVLPPSAIALLNKPTQ